MPETYARQEQLQLLIPPEVTVVGLGGIGSWVAIDLAMSGVQTLYLYDPDMMEETNRNRLPFCLGSLNRPKVEVVRDFIMAIRPEATVIAIPDKLSGILLQIQMGVSSTFVECTDSPKSQMIIYNACKERRKTFIRAGYDGTHITVTSVMTSWGRNDEEEATYTVNPSWVVPAQIVAALAVGKLLKYHNQEVSLDISEIGIPVLQRQRRLTARCTQPTPTTPARRRVR